MKSLSNQQSLQNKSRPASRVLRELNYAGPYTTMKPRQILTFCSTCSRWQHRVRPAVQDDEAGCQSAWHKNSTGALAKSSVQPKKEQILIQHTGLPPRAPK